MLNAHSEISFTPETHFLRKHIANLKEHKLFQGGNYKSLKKEFHNDPDLNRLEIDITPLIDKLDEVSSLIDFYDLVLYSHLHSKGKKYIGDKDPKNLEHLSQINQIYPNAYIIHIIRDPRDVILSRLKAEWSSNRGKTIHSITYHLQYNKASSDGRKLFKNHYYEIHYEDLITHPEKTLSCLCDFLGVRFENNMLEFYQSSNEIIKGRETSWKKECFKPVKKDNLNKWKESFSSKETYLIEKICFSVFKDKTDKYQTSQNTVYLKTKIITFFIRICLPFTSYCYNLYHKIKNCLLKKYL